MNEINSFRGEYAFLSNFYSAPVTYKGITYLNNEAAFQAQKVSSDSPFKDMFPKLNPSEAKKLGRRVTLIRDWEKVKDQFMYEICTLKFIQNEDLKERLLATGDAKLIEGNDWGDTYWGVCRMIGQNKLGEILMRVREELRRVESD